MIKKFLIMNNNEKGSAVLIALLAMAALSVVGFSSMETSMNEMKIVRNEKIYNLNFYKAESINQRGMQQLLVSDPNQALNLQPATSTVPYISDLSGLDMTDSTNWIVGTNCTGRLTNPPNTFPENTPALDHEERFAAVYQGIAGGGSISMSGSVQTHIYKVYGLSQHNNGEVLIETGYRVDF
ncbi:MAG: pilus assembly PilX N-terminal domain-containing protein [Desulfobacteraceae bacterium]|nr:pilus assembly PilX N-terminal domain-containing protein [Desulfobacteraceae bacterium]